VNGTNVKRRRWDQAAILAAIKRWVKEVGEVPSSEDWENKNPHPHWVAKRGEFPTRQTITNHFPPAEGASGWVVALRSAGIEPRMVRGAGERTKGRLPDQLRARKATLEDEIRAIEEQLDALEPEA